MVHHPLAHRKLFRSPASSLEGVAPHTGKGGGGIINRLESPPDNCIEWSMAENDSQDQRIHELAKEVAVLRADMKTNYAETESALDRLRADMAQRENRLLLAIIVVVGVATAILGVLIAGIPAT